MNSTNINKPNDLPVLPNYGTAVGFMQPTDSHNGLDLNQYVIKHPAATFFVRAAGESMCDAGILHNDLLIVDKSLTPKDGSIIVAILNNEFVVKRLKIIAGKGFLYSANNKYKPLAISDIDGLQIWGVVTHAIHDLRTS